MDDHDGSWRLVASLRRLAESGRAKQMIGDVVSFERIEALAGVLEEALVAAPHAGPRLESALRETDRLGKEPM